MARKVLPLALSLFLVGPALADDSSSLKVEVKDGRVRVEIKTRDGKKWDREVGATDVLARMKRAWTDLQRRLHRDEDTVKVHVGDEEKCVPSHKGKARLY
ncbi:MAG TPA: hypothetical protein VFF73_04685 [Planctomycetota bacterium]|nr:hypothetical protein [Planctomycetota bacterium]